MNALILHSGGDSTIDYFLVKYLVDLGYSIIRINIKTYTDFSKIIIDNFSLIVLVRYWPMQRFWNKVLDRARRSSIKCVYFMDDNLFDKGSFSNLPRNYRNKLISQAYNKKRIIVCWSDEIWVSSKYLESIYSTIGALCIPLKPLPSIIHQCQDVVRIGYHGTESHALEIDWLFPIISEIQKLHKNTLIEIYGGDNCFKKYKSISRVRVHRPIYWTSYRAITSLESLDIMLCPLLEHSFNLSRSPVKFFDAVRLSAVGIYSNRTPYSEFVENQIDGLLVEDDYMNWINSINNLICSKDDRLRMLDAAQKKINNHFV